MEQIRTYVAALLNQAVCCVITLVRYDVSELIQPQSPKPGLGFVLERFGYYHGDIDKDIDMIQLPDPGLYRTTQAYPGYEDQIPAGVLVYVGKNEAGTTFVVRPGSNRLNRWYWGEPTLPLRSTVWAKTLKSLPSEGFYNLPQDLVVGEGGRWVKNAIVQLGYNAEGQGIIFVAERHDTEERNVLAFSDRGMIIDDALLERLIWAPILPVSS